MERRGILTLIFDASKTGDEALLNEWILHERVVPLLHEDRLWSDRLILSFLSAANGLEAWSVYAGSLAIVLLEVVTTSDVALAQLQVYLAEHFKHLLVTYHITWVRAGNGGEPTRPTMEPTPLDEDE